MGRVGNTGVGRGGGVKGKHCSSVILKERTNHRVKTNIFHAGGGTTFHSMIQQCGLKEKARRGNYLTTVPHNHVTRKM